MKKLFSVFLFIVTLCFLQVKPCETLQDFFNVSNFNVFQNYSGVYLTQGSVLQDTDWNSGGTLMSNFTYTPFQNNWTVNNSFLGGLNFYTPVSTAPGFPVENQFLNYTPIRTGNFYTPGSFSPYLLNSGNFFTPPAFTQFNTYPNSGNLNYYSLDSQPYFPVMSYTHWSMNPADIVEGIPYRHAH